MWESTRQSRLCKRKHTIPDRGVPWTLMHPSPATADPTKPPSTYPQHKLLKSHSSLNRGGTGTVLSVILFKISKALYLEQKLGRSPSSLFLKWGYSSASHKHFLNIILGHVFRGLALFSLNLTEDNISYECYRTVIFTCKHSTSLMIIFSIFYLQISGQILRCDVPEPT